MHVGPDDHVLRDRHSSERTNDLKGPAHARLASLVWQLADDIPAAQDDLARVGTNESIEQIKESCFSGSVGANNAEHFALHDFQADVLNSLQAPESLGHVLRFKHDGVG